jgi:pyruvate,orthophosphate dikinase
VAVATIRVCDEHGGGVDSVRFFHEVGMDNVSCSPFRVPIARLEAGRGGHQWQQRR